MSKLLPGNRGHNVSQFKHVILTKMPTYQLIAGSWTANQHFFKHGLKSRYFFVAVHKTKKFGMSHIQYIFV